MTELTDGMKAEILALIRDNLTVDVSVDDFGLYNRQLRVRVSLHLSDEASETTKEFSFASDHIGVSSRLD